MPICFAIAPHFSATPITCPLLCVGLDSLCVMVRVIFAAYKPMQLLLLQHSLDVSIMKLNEVHNAVLGHQVVLHIEDPQPEWCISSMIYIVEIHHSGRKPSISDLRCGH